MAEEKLPEVDVSIDDVGKFYNVSRMQIVKGIVLKLMLVNWSFPSRWVSENDPVLSIVHEPGNEAEVTAKEIGESTVFILQATKPGEKLVTIKEIIFTIVEQVIEEAVDLNPVLGEEVQK